MKSFRFSLQSLRVLREQRERVAQKHYAEALLAAEEAAAQLEAGSHELAEGRSMLCKEVLAGNTVSRLQQVRAWCSQLEQNCDRLAAALKSAEDTTSQAWQEMLLATRDRKALDSLHRQRRRAYDYAVQREEQKHLDEMGLRVTEASSHLREITTLAMEQP